MTIKHDASVKREAGISAAPLPLFYRRPEPLRVAEHGRAGLVRPGSGYGFAQAASAVPIVLAEFALASRHYPIVFVGENDPVPVAVLGSDRDANGHVDDDGAWLEHHYVPAYVRRYPFIPISGADGSMSLGIDTACEGYVSECGDLPGAERLFDGSGKPAAFVEDAMRLCEDYNKAHTLTSAFCAALREAGMLSPCTLRMADGRVVRGFHAVDARLRNLGDSTVLEWWRKGWMDAIALHHASQQNWSALVRLGTADAAQKSAASGDSALN